MREKFSDWMALETKMSFALTKTAAQKHGKNGTVSLAAKSLPISGAFTRVRPFSAGEPVAESDAGLLHTLTRCMLAASGGTRPSASDGTGPLSSESW